MNTFGHALWHAARVITEMTWQVTWSLILGFTLSAAIEAVVSKAAIVRLLPDDRPASLARATVLGAASSSCSYAATALARSLFRKGADFTAAMAFQFASTNLVIELGLILAFLLGWQFTAAEFVGGPLMIVFLALMFRRFLTTRMVDTARVQAELAVPGSMEGHAAMDMSVGGDGVVRRLCSPAGFTSVSHNFVMEWAAILRDLAIGLVVAGCAAAWVPDTFWAHLFFTGHPVAAKIWGPLIGPIVAAAAFVCSIGNVPLAAVLWTGGISFGGVVSFVFADLLIFPLLLIYRRYYGARMMWFLTGTFYVAMVAAGYVVELVFGTLHLIPHRPAHLALGTEGIRWNYTSWLDLAFLAVAATLLWRFIRTGAWGMLSMMGGGPDGMSDHPPSDHAPSDHAPSNHAHPGCGSAGSTDGAPNR